MVNPNGGVEPYNPGAPPTPGAATSSFGNSQQGRSYDPNDPTVFMGWGHATVGTDAPRSGPGGQGGGYDAHSSTHRVRGAEHVNTVSQALLTFDAFSRKDFLHFRNLFIAAGLVGEGADPMTVRSAYQAILTQVAGMQQNGVPHLTPQAYVNNLIQMNGLDPSKIGSGANFTLKKDQNLEPYTKTQKSVYDLSPEDARATLEDSMTRLLGRAPTEEEIHDFINAAQTAAKKDPTTAQQTFTPGDTGLKGDSSNTVTNADGTTTTTDANGTTVTTQNQGFSAQDVSQMAQDRAKNAPDYASYQAAATYFPALMSILGASGGA